ncbi:MAG TPA: hypothetical protein VLM85_25865 [Polyangiaceae bacterium]|nr:hypothetical protein [Polyangiaceae bacterium]
MRFLTVAALLAGCGARSSLDEANAGADASSGADVADVADVVNDAASPPVLCPTGPAPAPVLVAHIGAQPLSFVGPHTASELLGTLRAKLDDGLPAYRVVALSKCGAVRDIASAPMGSPMLSIVLRGDALFVSDGYAGVYEVPVSGGTLTLRTVEAGALAVDDTDIYVAAPDHVSRTPRAGGPTVVIAGFGADTIAVDDAFVYLEKAYGVLRLAKSDPSQIATLAAPNYSAGYWWSSIWLAVSPTQVFFPSGSTTYPNLPVCAVPKGGGDVTCTQPAEAPTRLVWDGALYFTAYPGIDKIADIDAGATQLASVTSHDAPFTLWVDDTSVWWLTLSGDLYRVDK